MFLTYVALVHRVSKKSSSYGVMFPDFPGCVSSGKTLDEALKNAREGLLFHMEGMLDGNEMLPEPTSLEEILSEEKYEEGIPCLVHLVPPTGHLKRVNISIDANLLAEVDHAAESLGKNRSEFFAFAARQIIA